MKLSALILPSRRWSEAEEIWRARGRAGPARGLHLRPSLVAQLSRKAVVHDGPYARGGGGGHEYAPTGSARDHAQLPSSAPAREGPARARRHLERADHGGRGVGRHRLRRHRAGPRRVVGQGATRTVHRIHHCARPAASRARLDVRGDLLLGPRFAPATGPRCSVLVRPSS